MERAWPSAVRSLTPASPGRRPRLHRQLLQPPLSLPAAAADRSDAELRTGVPPYHDLSSCTSSGAMAPVFNRIALSWRLALWSPPTTQHCCSQPASHRAVPQADAEEQLVCGTSLETSCVLASHKASPPPCLFARSLTPRLSRTGE